MQKVIAVSRLGVDRLGSVGDACVARRIGCYTGSGVPDGNGRECVFALDLAGYVDLRAA